MATSRSSEPELTTSLADATARISSKIDELRKAYGVETLLIITRGNLNQPPFAKALASRRASRFITDVLRTDPSQLARKIEGYVVSGAGSPSVLNPPIDIKKMKQKEQIKIARDCILNGLTDILREQNFPEDQIPKTMNYKSYETKIVDQCGVVLIGFPGEKGIVNPGELDAVMLKELLSRLNDGRCHWEPLDKRKSSKPTSRGQTPFDRILDSPRWLPDSLSSDGTPSEGTGPSGSSEDDDMMLEDPNANSGAAYQWQSPDSLTKAMELLQRAYVNACVSLIGDPGSPNPTLPPDVDLSTLFPLPALSGTCPSQQGNYAPSAQSSSSPIPNDFFSTGASGQYLSDFPIPNGLVQPAFLDPQILGEDDPMYWPTYVDWVTPQHS